MSENFTPNFSTDSFATSRNSSRERYAADPTKMSSAAWKQFPDLESVADLEPEKSSQENPPSQDLEGSELHTDTEVSPHSSNHSIRSSENTFCDLVVRNYVIAFRKCTFLIYSPLLGKLTEPQNHRLFSLFTKVLQ